MKKVLSIILLLPIILFVVALDIIKLPLMIFIMPLTLLFALSDGLRGDGDWLSNWIDFNLEFGCFTYMMRDELFGI